MVHEQMIKECAHVVWNVEGTGDCQRLAPIVCAREEPRTGREGIH